MVCHSSSFLLYFNNFGFSTFALWVSDVPSYTVFAYLFIHLIVEQWSLYNFHKVDYICFCNISATSYLNMRHQCCYFQLTFETNHSGGDVNVEFLNEKHRVITSACHNIYILLILKLVPRVYSFVINK